MIRWLVRLYAFLLRLYPAGFRAAFAGEMVDVFGQGLHDARRRGWGVLLLRCGREFAALLPAVLREQWYNLRQEDALMSDTQMVNRDGDSALLRPATPVEITAGVLPFILFGLMFVLNGVDSHRSLWAMSTIVPYLVVHVLVLVGLGVGWARGFPRWSNAYLGLALMTSVWLAGIMTAGFRLFGYTFGRERWGWRAWAPLLLLAAVMLLLTRSARPLRRLLHGLRRDWTQLSFALYAAVSWLLMLVTLDSRMIYNDTVYLPLHMGLLALATAVGAYFYMRNRRPWTRALALQAALLLYLPIGLFIGALDGHIAFGFPGTPLDWLLYLLLWLAWVSVPLWPGLARGAARLVRPA